MQSWRHLHPADYFADLYFQEERMQDRRHNIIPFRLFAIQEKAIDDPFLELNVLTARKECTIVCTTICTV